MAGRETKLRQNIYRELHRDRVKKRREPTGRDVASALGEIFIESAAMCRHAVDRIRAARPLVARLVLRGFGEQASAAFVERMIDRRIRANADAAAGIDDDHWPRQC